jgi:hypothetical protein
MNAKWIKLPTLFILTFFCFFQKAAAQLEDVSEHFKSEESTQKIKDALFILNNIGKQDYQNNFQGELNFLLDNENPSTWLYKRASHFVPLEKRNQITLTFSEEEYIYPNPVENVIQEINHNEEPHEKASLLMSNLGVEFYQLGKQKKKLVKAEFDNLYDSHLMLNRFINSPRVGIIGISNQYFKPEFYISETGNQEADNIALLSFLFHEARHSDGEGKHLGFPHVLCPDYSDYAGLYACDKPFNGSYGIAAQLLNNFIPLCSSCNEKESEVLKLLAIDFEQRVINDNAMTLEKKNAINDDQNRLQDLYERKYFSDLESELSIYEQYDLDNQIYLLEQRVKYLKNTESYNTTYWDSHFESINI